jgi:diguanylate cyclase (GGDEF)-like protein/PAS domain S-box-containing protein
MAQGSAKPEGNEALQACRAPPDEADRIKALRRLGLLDTPPAESFDRFTRLAARAVDVPIALISLVDDTRQWFKSRYGLDLVQTPREVSFCAHAVLERQPLLVRDATLDPRFVRNSLVTGAPHIRAYLGIPIFTLDGHVIGTLCAIDRRPRNFDHQDVEALSDLAKLLQDAIHAKELAAQTDNLLRLATENEQLFRDTFEKAAIGMSHTNLAGQLVRINQHACDMLGYTAEELIHKSFVDITHPDDIAENSRLFQQVVTGSIERYHVEKRYVRKDGSYLWSSLSVALKRSRSGEPDYLIAVLEDISSMRQAQADLTRVRDQLQSEVARQTEKLHATNDALRTQVKRALESERAVRSAEQRLRTIANGVPAMIGYWNRDLQCEFANEAYRDAFGLGPDEIAGMNMRDLLGEALFKAVEPHARLALDGQAQRFETTITKPDGSSAMVEASYVPDVVAASGVRGFYAQVADITALRRAQVALEAANAKLMADSATDFLTGLANRRVFSERSEEASRRFRDGGEGYGLILLDLDNFKLVNDGFGHDVGDEVLRTVGRVLKSGLRNHRDLAARLGGEEFAILCFGELDENSLCQLAERIRSQLKKEAVESKKATVRVTASFGVATSYADDTDWKSIYSRADSALYLAKDTGKDRVIFGRTSVDSATARLRALQLISGK